MMIIGVLATLIQGSIEVGGFAKAWEIAVENERVWFTEYVLLLFETVFSFIRINILFYGPVLLQFLPLFRKAYHKCSFIIYAEYCTILEQFKILNSCPGLWLTEIFSTSFPKRFLRSLVTIRGDLKSKMTLLSLTNWTLLISSPEPMHAKSPDLPEFQVVILGTNLIQDDCPDLFAETLSTPPKQLLPS